MRVVGKYGVQSNRDYATAIGILVSIQELEMLVVHNTLSFWVGKENNRGNSYFLFMSIARWE